MPVIQISSDTTIPIEQHFRLSAGPGAGKTHWLINHIKSVLHQSQRLSIARRIACITYTNVAVETIQERLGASTDRVEVSTIHSFLYRHVVKPYAVFAPREYELNAGRVDGHDEHRVESRFLMTWIENHAYKTELRHPYLVNQLTKLQQNIEALKRWLATLRFGFDSTGNLRIFSDRTRAFYLDGGQRHYLGNRCLDVLEKDLLSYKYSYWREGILHHEDVLFLSYQLIQNFPFILHVLRAKFPYFFVDEFQDTNPIQAKILEQIGLEETVVGIIGDKAQSIYGFQGAAPSQFNTFSLPDLVDYQIEDNRRSTNQIITLLNTIRTDIHQRGIIDQDGEDAIIFVDGMMSALGKAQELCTNETVHSLSRDNVTANAMKRGMEEDIPSDDLLQRLYETDSNGVRRRLLIACIKATELAVQKRFKEAIKELERVFKDGDKNTGTREALKTISVLLQHYDEIETLSLLDFHSFVRNHISSAISDISIRRNPTQVQSFYEEHTYQQLAVCAIIKEDASLHRTIHKAKGDEFDNLLLVLQNENDMDFFLNPDLGNNEEHRIYYVAVSRAKKRLFISVPTLLDGNRSRLEGSFSIQ